MSISCEYANPSPDVSRVVYHFDADSMTILNASDPLVVQFVTGGGVVGPYVAPPAPPTQDQLDTATINALLMQDGSIVKALGIVVRDVIKGTIPVTPSLTNAQFMALLKARI